MQTGLWLSWLKQQSLLIFLNSFCNDFGIMEVYILQACDAEPLGFNM